MCSPFRRPANVLFGTLVLSLLFSDFNVAHGQWLRRRILGHRITTTGPNGYIYEPVYESLPENPALIPGEPAFEQEFLSYDDGPEGVTVDSNERAATYAERVRELGLQPAIDQFQRGRYALAIAELDRLAGGGASLPEADLLRAHALCGLAEYDEAADTLRWAMVNLPPADWNGVIANRGRWFNAKADRFGEYVRAIADHAERHPRDEAAWFLLGFHQGYAGEVAAGREALLAALELNPDDTAARRLLEIFPRVAHRSTAGPIPPNARSQRVAAPREF